MYHVIRFFGKREWLSSASTSVSEDVGLQSSEGLTELGVPASKMAPSRCYGPQVSVPYTSSVEVLHHTALSPQDQWSVLPTWLLAPLRLTDKARGMMIFTI